MIHLIPIPLTAAGILASLHKASFEDPWSQGAFDQFLHDSTTCGWLAVQEEGMPLGFILARVVLDEAEILTFAVNPNVRRQGVGRLLVKELQNFLSQESQEKIVKVFLEVAVTNKGAIDLYRSLGFTEVSCRPNYYTSASLPPVSAKIFVWETK